MYQDFIIKQTKDTFNNQYKSNVLVGNWYEQRCDHGDPHNSFHPETKFVSKDHEKTVLSRTPFLITSQNFINFQSKHGQFVTEMKDNYRRPAEQVRLSEIKPTKVTMSEFYNNKDSLQAYRDKWTKGPQIYDRSRTYLGAK